MGYLCFWRSVGCLPISGCRRPSHLPPSPSLEGFWASILRHRSLRHLPAALDVRNFDRVDAETGGEESGGHEEVEEDEMDSFEELERHRIQVILLPGSVDMLGDCHSIKDTFHRPCPRSSLYPFQQILDCASSVKATPGRSQLQDSRSPPPPPHLCTL